MSITFEPVFRASDISGWHVTHAGLDQTPASATRPTHAEALDDLVAHNTTCLREDCLAYGGDVTAAVTVEVPSLNVNSFNARLIGEALGLDCEEMLCGGGSLDASAFRDRVITARLLAPADEGLPFHEDTPLGRIGGVTSFNCGRRPGYLQEKLDELLTVADFAVATGREVQWA